jgi:glycosyltransferase involved in cell wall biosynthesis
MPHFVRWYRNLGVDRFHLIVHGPWDEANLAALAALPGVEITQRLHEPFCKTLKCDAITAVARRSIGEWILIADADEFLELPADGIAGTIAALEAAGIDELYATLIQRVAADGSLPEVGPDSDLDATFPMFHVGLCEDMGLVNPAWRSKYPLARVGPDFVYQRGNHLPGNRRSVAHAPMRGVLHHFKWRGRLFDAFSRERGEGTNFREMAVYRNWLEAHGRLPMAGAKPCSRAALEAEGWLRRPSAAEQAGLAALVRERDLAAAKRLRVGLVTFELGGPGTPNGGIATAMSALAKLQAAHGIDVEVFYCPFQQPRELPPLWFEYWSTFGVKLHYIPRHSTTEDRGLETLEVANAIVEAVRKEGRFDLLHFHDTQGFAAPFGMRKAEGVEFTETTIAITTHGGTRWHNEPNGTPWDEDAYRQELIAQRLCDVVVSPSAYLIGWNRDLAALPERTIVLPNVLEPESKSFAARPERPIVPRCLAFFGRVEQRKGFDLFLAALRELAATTDLRPDVLVLGRFGNGQSQARFDAETAGLPFRIEHHRSLNPQQALRLLKERTALAIMPSRLENSPYVAYEAMENQLPFLVSFTGGTAELVRPEDWPQAELPMDPPAMAAKFAEVLRHGLQPARLALDPLEIELRNLVTWRELAEQRGGFGKPSPAPRFARHGLSDWRSAAARDPGELVALVPEGLVIDEGHLRSMAGVLSIDPSTDAVEGYAAVVDDELGTATTSRYIRSKATRHEAAALAGPQPVVIRAGTLAGLAADLERAAPEGLYPALMTALDAAGKDVLGVPLCTHVHRMRTGLEQRSLGTRLWLPVGRQPKAERPARSGDQIWQLCGRLHEDPYVAISMFSTDTPFGALSLHPEAFEGRPSLHLITLGNSLLWAVPTMLPQRIAEARRRWPQAHFRVLASDEVELKALRSAGIPAILGNLNMFADERVFRPLAPREGDPVEPAMDAVCIGALELRENHYLARLIPSLGLVHNRYEGMEDVGDEVRKLLPQATYLTDSAERPEGFFYPSNDQLVGWINRASTGLALSQTGGTCLPTAQYLLCGTPVVSVPNIGGRDHFLEAPYALTAEPTAEAVAAAVAELKARNLPREEVHAAAVRRFTAARGRFLDEVNGAMRELFGGADRVEEISELVGGACRYRRMTDVLRIPASPAPEEVAAAAEEPPPPIHAIVADETASEPTSNGTHPYEPAPEPRVPLQALSRRPRPRWISWLVGRR